LSNLTPHSVAVGKLLRIPTNEKICVILTIGKPADDESLAFPFPKFRFPAAEMFVHDDDSIASTNTITNTTTNTDGIGTEETLLRSAVQTHVRVEETPMKTAAESVEAV
jgi:hypothetical protein